MGYNIIPTVSVLITIGITFKLAQVFNYDNLPKLLLMTMFIIFIAKQLFAFYTDREFEFNLFTVGTFLFSIVALVFIATDNVVGLVGATIIGVILYITPLVTTVAKKS